MIDNIIKYKYVQRIILHIILLNIVNIVVQTTSY